MPAHRSLDETSELRAGLGVAAEPIVRNMFNEEDTKFANEYFLSRRLLERLHYSEHENLEKMNSLIEEEHGKCVVFLKDAAYQHPTDGHVFFLYRLTPDLIIRYYMQVTGLPLDVVSEY